ncbi:hypothetical protein Bca52824_021588 [Brassica carinata]|uniref:Uncharacterized protein n=1 Tax=Brassica carinata TaxID=52824 RepID=A0A8X7VF02_BRACI|nr:hypothetical protein Bca52824_021588 [Brassica carinata]
MEEETTCYYGCPEDFDPDEDMQLFDQELDKIGGGYEIDFNKFRYCFGWKPLDLDDGGTCFLTTYKAGNFEFSGEFSGHTGGCLRRINSSFTMVDEPETNRDFIATLANLVLTNHNEKELSGTNLELGNILIANFHLSCGFSFYISFQVNDPSDNQTKPYRAVVRYFPGEIEVVSCNPKD